MIKKGDKVTIKPGFGKRGWKYQVEYFVEKISKNTVQLASISRKKFAWFEKKGVEKAEAKVEVEQKFEVGDRVTVLPDSKWKPGELVVVEVDGLNIKVATSHGSHSVLHPKYLAKAEPESFTPDLTEDKKAKLPDLILKVLSDGEKRSTTTLKMDMLEFSDLRPSLEDIEAIASSIPKITSRTIGTTNYYRYEENSQESGNLANVNVDNKEIHGELPALSYAWINAEDIDWDRTQPRARVNQQAIASYAELMRLELWDWMNETGKYELPVLFIDDEEYYPSAGHHRGRAAKSLGKKIYCEIRNGSKLDALIAATQSNKNPQLPVTAADKKHALRGIFEGLIEKYGSVEEIPWAEQHGRWKDDGIFRGSVIAEWVGVSRRTITNYRNELIISEKISHFRETFEAGQRFETIQPFGSLPKGATGTWLGQYNSKGLLIEFDESEYPKILIKKPTGYVDPSFLKPTDKPAPAKIEIEEEFGVAPQSNGLKPKSVEQETQQQAESLGLNGKGSQVLPDTAELPPEPVVVEKENEPTGEMTITLPLNIGAKAIASTLRRHYSGKEVNIVDELGKACSKGDRLEMVKSLLGTMSDDDRMKVSIFADEMSRVVA